MERPHAIHTEQRVNNIALGKVTGKLDSQSQ